MAFLRTFVQRLDQNLDKALSAKTSWGRNDLKLLIQTVLSETLLEILEKHHEPK